MPGGDGMTDLPQHILGLPCPTRLLILAEPLRLLGPPCSRMCSLPPALLLLLCSLIVTAVLISSLVLVCVLATPSSEESLPTLRDMRARVPTYDLPAHPAELLSGADLPQ